MSWGFEGFLGNGDIAFTDNCNIPVYFGTYRGSFTISSFQNRYVSIPGLRKNQNWVVYVAHTEFGVSVDIENDRVRFYLGLAGRANVNVNYSIEVFTV